METLIIMAHPQLEKSKINQRWVQELQKYPDKITIHDLYASYQDWKIDVQLEQELAERFKRIVFQFPMYWYSSPPMLKKWFDDVLTYGWARTSKGGKLKGKEFGLAISMGGSKHGYQNNAFSPLNEVLSPFRITASLIEMKYMNPFTLFETDHISVEKLDESARDYVNYVLGSE